MPKFTLLLSCELENLSELNSDPDTRWYMKFKCNHCSEETSKWVYVSAEEEHQHGRGKFNLLITCSLCKRQHSVDVTKTMTYRGGGYQPVAEFECRGITPIAYDPRVGWTATHPKSGKTFECDLAEDFADFDDEEQEPVGVYEVTSKFE